MNNTTPVTQELIRDMEASINKNSIRSGKDVEQQLNSNIINNGELRKGGRRIFKKRPTARRRSSKVRKSRKARTTRRR